MLLMFVRVPLSSQFLIGVLDLEERSVFSNAKDGIVVFEG